jgi:alpha-1,6-mannosyltransferase
VTLSPSRTLYVLGASIFVSLFFCSRCKVGTHSFLIGIDIAGVAYLLAVREFFRTRRFPRRVVFACLALSALWRIPFVVTQPGSDDDVHRYLWDGRVQRFGLNPYTAIPADPSLAWLHTPQTRGVNNPEVPSPYPAGAELFFRAVTTVHESIFAFKIAFLACDFGVVFLLLDVLRRSGLGEHWVLAYAWHPLLPLNVAGSPHVDILGALVLLISVVSLERRWRMRAAAAFSLAVAIKLLPIVLAPLYWRRLRVRDWLLAALVFGLVYLPFLRYGRLPLGSLGTYIHRFRFNDPVFATLERLARPKVVAGLAVVAGLVTAAWLRIRQVRSADRWAWPMAASLACAPVIYPWYLIWLLPFVRSKSTLPLIVWTISILPTYVVWHLRTLGHEWVVPVWVSLLEYGAVAVTATILWLHSHSTKVRGPAPEQVIPAAAGRDAGPPQHLD